MMYGRSSLHFVHKPPRSVGKWCLLSMHGMIKLCFQTSSFSSSEGICINPLSILSKVRRFIGLYSGKKSCVVNLMNNRFIPFSCPALFHLETSMFAQFSVLGIYRRMKNSEAVKLPVFFSGFGVMKHVYIALLCILTLSSESNVHSLAG